MRVYRSRCIHPVRTMPMQCCRISSVAFAPQATARTENRVREHREILGGGRRKGDVGPSRPSCKSAHSPNVPKAPPLRRTGELLHGFNIEPAGAASCEEFSNVLRTRCSHIVAEPPEMIAPDLQDGPGQDKSEKGGAIRFSEARDPTNGERLRPKGADVRGSACSDRNARQKCRSNARRKRCALLWVVCVGAEGDLDR